MRVADEAVATGRQAAQVDSLLDAMADQVGQLGAMLNQVVRTATPEVNRREAPRFAVGDKKARLVCREGEYEGALADISVTGARLMGVDGGANGDQGTIHLDEVRVPVKVVEARDGMVRVRMARGEERDVARWIDRQGAAAPLA